MPFCEFMQVVKAHSPFRDWASILEGRKVTKLGSRWNVGDDKSFNLWKYKWIPQETNFKVPFEKPQEAVKEKVVDLIDQQKLHGRIV